MSVPVGLCIKFAREAVSRAKVIWNKHSLIQTWSQSFAPNVLSFFQSVKTYFYLTLHLQVPFDCYNNEIDNAESENQVSSNNNESKMYTNQDETFIGFNPSQNNNAKRATRSDRPYSSPPERDRRARSYKEIIIQDQEMMDLDQEKVEPDQVMIDVDATEEKDELDKNEDWDQPPSPTTRVDSICGQ